MDVLADNPLLLLFLVVGLGAALGRVRFRGVGSGPAAALFVGLAFSAADADLANTPPVVPTLGLALYIDTIGLASGPVFIDGFRQGVPGSRSAQPSFWSRSAVSSHRSGGDALVFPWRWSSNSCSSSC